VGIHTRTSFKRYATIKQKEQKIHDLKNLELTKNKQKGQKMQKETIINYLIKHKQEFQKNMK